ncbi:SLATT domain-containing protein [Blastococcus atacamensis]|uniref:SLATT domain-containing protein n=1 Tax=Blastococcus atacamensis TaxID=2070508 RepID=UPI0012FFE4BD|nr:SLATT domain-containing protein [Blastococcus atacamensis]
MRALQVDLLWTEKAQFATAALYARLHLWLGIVATVAAAVAAATVVAEAAPVISGSAAVVAAIASAIVTFLKPQDTEQKHLTAGRRLGALRVKVRQALDLDLHLSQPEQPDAWRALARTFAEEKATIDADAPGTSNRAFRGARKKIEPGHFDHGSSP